MRQPRGLPYNFKATKIIRFGIAIFFMGKEEKPLFKPSNVNSFGFFLVVTLLGWPITHLSPQGPHLEPQSNQIYHKDNQILLHHFYYG